MSDLDLLVDPTLGIVLGYSWGSKAGQLVLDHPDAVLVRDEAEIQEYALPEPIEIADVALTVTLEFRLDELITLRLEPHDDAARLAFDAAHPLLAAAREWFSEPLTTPDEGLWVGEEAGTRMAIDLLEQRVVFLDSEV